MKHYDIEKAKEFFAAKAAFTTGLHEVGGMIKRGEDIVKAGRSRARKSCHVKP